MCVGSTSRYGKTATVARPETSDSVTSLARHGRHHEVQAVGMEDSSGAKGASEAVEGRPSIIPQPALLVEIVDGDEMAPSDVVHREPVVAAETLSDVVQALDTQVPACGERVSQLLFIESLGQRPHWTQDTGDYPPSASDIGSTLIPTILKCMTISR